MEIAFLSAPEANANMGTPASCVCPRQEFSLLMAALLKSTQPEALVNAGLPVDGELSGDGPVDINVLAGEGAEIEAGPVLKAEESADDAPAQITDALASLFVPVGINRAPHEGAAMTEHNSRPALVSGMTDFSKAGFTLEPATDGKQQTQAAENASASMKDGRMELRDLEVPSALDKEHFEIEIPAEEIMGRKDEHKAGLPLVADAAKASEGTESALLEAPVSLEATASTESENILSDQARLAGQEIAGASSSSMREFEGDGGQEENPGQNNSSETQAVKTTESGLTGLTFEKAIGQQAQKIDLPAAKPAVTVEVHEKVQAGIKVSVENNGGEVKMKLHPESLGEVRIKLNVASGMVRAEIIVENPEVKSIIESDSSFLRDSLGAHGLTLDKCVVEVGRSFEAGQRESGDRRSAYNEEHRPASDNREHEKGNNGWHRHFRHNQARHEEGGIDFFA